MGDERRPEGSDFDRLLARLLEAERSRRRVVPTPPRKAPRKRRLATLAVVGLSMFLILSATLWIYQDSSWRISAANSSAGPRAALLDPLSATMGDPGFTDSIRTTLTSAGYSLDIFKPTQVTVDFLRSLPLKGYSLIILRAHSGAHEIYTTEPYSTSAYVLEQLTDQVVPVRLDDRIYFSVTNNFVSQSMRGNFQGSLIVIMGCSGLFNRDMAEAFLGKGARAVVGWDGSVSEEHTDSSTSSFVKYLSEGKSVKDAVAMTSTTLGPDPAYGGKLQYYDFKVGLVQQIENELAGLSILLGILGIVAAGPITILVIPKLLSRR